MEPVQRIVVVRPDGGLTISIGESSVRLLNVGDDTAEVSSAEEIRVPPHFDGPPSKCERAIGVEAYHTMRLLERSTL